MFQLLGDVPEKEEGDFRDSEKQEENPKVTGVFSPRAAGARGWRRHVLLAQARHPPAATNLPGILETLRTNTICPCF